MHAPSPGPALRSLALLSAALAGCSTFGGGDAYLAYLETRAGGDVALGPSGGGVALGAIRNDYGSDLGLGGPDDALLIGGAIEANGGRLGGSLFWHDKSGDGSLGSDFGDIAAGSLVRTDFEFLAVKTYWVWDLLEGEHYRIAPGFAVDFLDASTSVAPISGLASESIDVFAPVPMLFVDGELRLGPVALAAQLGGSAIALRDGSGTYWDFESRLGYVPTERVELFAGYRLVAMDADGDADSRDAAVDLQIGGWFIGGELRF